MLSEISKRLTRDEILAVYNDIHNKAKKKYLVEQALDLIQQDFWGLTNYGTLLVWDSERNGYIGVTRYKCNCSETTVANPWCRHRVARLIVVRAANHVKTTESVRENPIW